MLKHKHEGSNRLNSLRSVLAYACLWCERRLISRQNIDVYREALRENARQQGVPLTDQQLDALARGTHGQMNTLLAANGPQNAQPPQPQAPGGINQVHPGESEEQAAERIAAGRTFEQQANQPHIGEAGMIGAAGLTSIPALAATYATVPGLWATGGIGPTAAFLAPVGVGAWAGKILGDRVGHPVAGSVLGASAGVATGYGVLASAPYLTQGLTGIQTGMTAMAAMNPYLMLTGGAGIGALAGGIIGRYTGMEHGGKIGAGVGAVVGAIPGVTGLLAPASLANVLSYAGPIGAFIAAPAALGAGLGYHFIGGKRGAVAGAIGGGLMGGSAWMLGTNAAAALGVTSLASSMFGPAVVGAGIAGGVYLGGKLHKLLWGGPQTGTLGTIGLGLISPLTVPAGLIYHLPGAIRGIGRGIASGAHALGETFGVNATLGSTVGAFFRGFSDDYEPRYKDSWFLPKWAEAITSAPGRLFWSLCGGVKGLVADPKHTSPISTVTSAPRRFWSHLWSDSKPLY